MKNNNIRWKQRFNNFIKAYQGLQDAVELTNQRELTKLEQQGLIQGFEYTHELAWNVLKDYLEEQGFVEIIGSKGATKEAFKQALIHDGETWMDMIKSRNLSSHTYNQELADAMIQKIISSYYLAMKQFSILFTKLYDKE